MPATVLNKRSTGVRQLAVRILSKVERGNIYPDDLLEGILSNSQLKRNDRALLVELVNGTLRQRGHLDWILAQLYRGDWQRMSSRLKQILRLTLYQIKFLDRVPDYAAVSEGVQLAKISGGETWGRIANGVLRNYLRKQNEISFPRTDQNKVDAIAALHSHPTWLIERWLRRYGEKNTLKYCEYNNRRPALSLRVNPKKTSRQELAGELRNAGFDVQLSQYLPDFLKVRKPKDPASMPGFQDGLFAIQDDSTALPSLLLNPQEGDRILDMCAAPGGKTCHLAQLANNRASLFAVDINSRRLQRLSENVARLGLRSVEIIESDATTIDLPNLNKIMLDAPCSGLGVLSKRSDLRWRRKPEDIRTICEVQRRLLEKAAKLLTPGGVLVYSTCTLEPEETDEMIQAFLHTHREMIIDVSFRLEVTGMEPQQGVWRTLPFLHEMDGGFSVRIIKK